MNPNVRFICAFFATVSAQTNVQMYINGGEKRGLFVNYEDGRFGDKEVSE